MSSSISGKINGFLVLYQPFQHIYYVLQIRCSLRDATRSSALTQRRPSFDLGQNEDAGLQQGEVFCKITLAFVV
jgi:hypothetical protein